MSLILSIETSGEKCSVAVHNSNTLLASAAETEPRSHAAKLAVLIKQAVNEAGISKSQLSAVAVSAGPGSYTGLRIGVSTAKGICYALGIPLVSVNTLDVLIEQAKQSRLVKTQLLCPMIDARRMEVYCKVVDSENHEVQGMRSVVVDEFTFAQLLDEYSILFFGNGASKCQQVIRHSHAKFIEGISPEAGAVGILALQKFNSGITEDVSNFEPVYLKEFLIKSQPKETV